MTTTTPSEFPLVDASAITITALGTQDVSANQSLTEATSVTLNPPTIVKSDTLFSIKNEYHSVLESTQETAKVKKTPNTAIPTTDMAEISPAQ